MIRMRLKYTASRARLAGTRADAEIGEKLRLGRGRGGRRRA
jgi:hypothetical protein